MGWFFLYPSDVLFFRDAHSYGAGEDHIANSFFPPMPSTLAGAIRSAILGASPIDWNAYGNSKTTDLYPQIGNPDNLDNSHFFMRGPFLATRSLENRTDGTDDEVEWFTPLPADSYQCEDNHDIEDEKIKYSCMRPVETPYFNTDWNVGKNIIALTTPNFEHHDAPEIQGWLSSVQLDDYFHASRDIHRTFTQSSYEEFYKFEPRTGIAMDHDRRCTKESMLFTTRFVRLDENIGLLFWIDDNIRLPKNGELALGGEKRAAHFEKISEEKINNLDRLNHMSKPCRKVKAVLLTPAYFSGCWQPKNQSWEDFLKIPKTELISVSLGKPLFVGGWNLANKAKRHKTMYPYIPPGSVYYFEFPEPGIDRFSRAFTESPQSIDYSRLGFGQVILGEWDWQTI